MDQPVELQLSHWLRVVARRMRLMAVIVLVCAGVGLVSGFMSPTTYTARTTVLLQQSLSQQGNEPSSNLQVLSQLAGSDLVQHEARLLVGEKPTLSVGVSGDGQVLTFKATAETAGAAQQAADAYAAAFRQLSSDAAARQLASAQQSLQDQIRQLDKSLDARNLSAGERDVLNARRANYAAALNKLLVQAQLLSGGQALVVSPAKAPTSADSRQLGLHTAVGLLVGLVVAAAVAGLVDRREDRVRSEHDLLQRLAGLQGGRDLALVPLLTPGRASDGKRDDGMPARPSSQTADAFAVLRASLTTSATGPTRVLMVAEPTRAVGTTPASLNLAAAFSRAGRRTVVASLDFRDDSDRGAMERVLTPPESRSRKIVRLPRAHAEQSSEHADGASEVTRLFPLTFRTVPNDDNLAVVTSGQLKSAEDLVASRPVQVFLESLVGIADVAVLEVPAVMSYPDAMLVWPHCHDALLVVQVGHSRTADVARAVERLSHSSQRTWAVAVLGAARRGTPGPLRALLVPPAPTERARDVVAPWPVKEVKEVKDVVEAVPEDRDRVV